MRIRSEMPTEDERRRILAVVAAELGAEVARLTAASEAQAHAISVLTAEVKTRTWKTTLKIRWMVALVILDLVLSGAMLVGYLKINTLVDSQESVRAQVLCPFYKVILGSYQPETRAPGPDRTKYEATFKEMWGQYGALRCVGALVPPRTDLVTTTPPQPR
jgi:hypothetical protein